jgi:hypothetical protein
MSIDHDASGGVGFHITDEIMKFAFSKGTVSEDRFNDSPADEIDRITQNTCLQYKEYGNAFTGDVGYIVVMDADNLEEVIILKELFVEKFNEVFGTNKTTNQLEIIVENHTW